MKLKLHIYNTKSLSNALVFQFLLLFFVQSIFAANWYVDDSSPVGNIYNLTNSPFVSGNDTSGDGSAIKPYATLSKAYTMATVGDIIYVDSGVYVSTGTIAFNKANIQIIGAGAANTIFESGSVSGTVRWGNLTANNAVFKGIQITKYDNASDGIAMTISAGTGIVFDQVIIYANVGSAGQGAFYISGAATSVTIKNSSLPCNRVAAANYGGALNINNATVVIDNCSLNNNVISALSGGAILIQGASANVTITKSTFDANGGTAGGAIAHTGGTLSITNSCFDANVTAGGGSLLGGGAILINPSVASNVNIANCTFSNNSTTAASSDGGAITMTNSSSITSTVVVSTCSFTTNAASDKGDDIYFDNFSAGVHDITFKNCTFNTIYAGTKVNLYNNDMPAGSIKFEGLSSPTGTGGCGDIVATPSGVAVSKPEMTGVYTETTSNIPTSLASTTCNDRFTGTCGAASATFSCLTTNIWGDVSTTASDADVVTFDKGANPSVIITVAAWAASAITFTKATHGLVVGNWITIEGFTPAGYNGYYKVTAVPTTGTFKVAKTVSPGACTVLGTFTKGTPIGWSRKTIPTVDEHVIIDYDYNTTTYGNIDACMMTVKSGKTLVTDNDSKSNAGVDALGTYVYVLNSIINNGTINVKTNGNLIQVNYPLDLNGDAIITPTISVNKDTGNKIKWDYVYWSKPVASSVLSNFSAFDLKYFWNPDFCVGGIDRSYLGWRTLTSEPIIGTGFITRVKTAAGTVPTPISLTMNGVSNNGDITATIKYYDGNDQAFRNFTLLGNPYPGAIKFEDFYNDNKSNIYGTVYLWTSNTPYPGSGEYSQPDYASFNLTGGVLGATTQSPTATVPNGYIASGQGFMIRPKVNGTILFKNTQRTKAIPSNNQFFKTNAPEKKDRFWLRISNSENKFNEQLIGYMSGATSGFDEAYDGPINSLSTIKFYSFIESQKLIIQGKGVFNKSDAINIGYVNSTTANMELKISISKTEGIFEANQKIYLRDKELGIYHNLATEPYVFTASTNTDNRFEIVYKLANEVDEVIEENTIHGIVASIKNNTLSVTADLDIKNIVLYDILGKVVFEKEILNNTSQFNTDVNVSAGIYIAKVTLANNTIETKKIIAQ
jgi:hypothetical protein